MDPNICLGMTFAVVPAYNAYKFGCYYDVYDPDWSVLTLTNFLWWTSSVILLFCASTNKQKTKNLMTKIS